MIRLIGLSSGLADSDLRAEEIVPLETLAGVPLIATPRSNSLRQIVDKALSEKGPAARTVAESTAGGLPIELTRMGMGYTVVPYSSVYNQVAQGTLSASACRSLRAASSSLLGRRRSD